MTYNAEVISLEFKPGIISGIDARYHQAYHDFCQQIYLDTGKYSSKPIDDILKHKYDARLFFNETKKTFELQFKTQESMLAWILEWD